MAYSHDLGMEFWYEFDELFQFNTTQEVNDAYDKLFDDFGQGIDLYRNLFARTRRQGTYPNAFVDELQKRRRKEGLREISDLQWGLMKTHFGSNFGDLRSAFEDFGHGVLFDSRRKEGDKVHKMDTSPGPPGGYHRWHPIIRAAVFIGEDWNRWLQIDRYVGLAWHIQSVAKPREDDSNNSQLSRQLLDPIRAKWLTASFEEIDKQFDSFPYPPDVV